MARAVHFYVRNRTCPVHVHASSPRPRGRLPELPLATHHTPRPAGRAGVLLGLALFATPAAAARAPDAIPGQCLPPHTVVALTPLTDRTDGVWTTWSGESPALLVSRLLADSLARGHRHDVLRLGVTLPHPPAAGPSRVLDDELALHAARRTTAEVVVTGSVDVFTHDDQLEPGKFARWGMGAPDARSHVRVSVSLRALDVRDGTVLIETTASRERTGKTVAMIDRQDRSGSSGSIDPLLAQALGEVLSDLTRTLVQRVEGHWKAQVLAERRGRITLDAGVARGLFAGQRLEVWRPAIELLDEDLKELGEDVWVGSVVVTSLEGTRSRARLCDGEVHVGDVLRPCSQAAPPVLSLDR